MKRALLRVQLLDENNNVQQVRVIEMSVDEVKLVQDGATALVRTHAKHAPPISLTDWVLEHINGAVDAAGYLDDVKPEERVWR